MLQQLFSLCRRLIGAKSEHASSGDDRRVWVRFPSAARTSVQPMANGSEVLLSARIRNVSQGGINLVVNNAFKAGDMISIDVPGNTAEEMSAVLACVVHAVPLPQGFWSLGCAFSEMLEEDDLAAFLTRKERASGSEKRDFARQSAPIKATYQFINDPRKQSWQAGVVNISLGGIGLEVDQSVDNGALLNLELENPAGEITTILACVVHVLSRGVSRRVLGCNFIHELSEADLHALV